MPEIGRSELRDIATRLYDRAMELDSLCFGDFTLSSGQKSTYYFDGRMLSTDPEGADLISKAFSAAIDDAGAEAFGGPTVAAVPIVGALALRSQLDGKKRTGFFVRPEQKEHGAGKQIEGNLQPGMRAVAFDDTVSTGGALLSAIDAVEAFGCEVVMVMAILDRHQGGGGELERRGIPFFKLWESTPEGKVTIAV
ncbi:MAG TPA: orotate phosphoribosyltransferase [Dehalococcoidia bacterium]|jgi:orotate phosphoribosyltransferase|nr:orotate phosphoribosyltransferase [Dehalococcoidia bacterium]MDP7262192.1 orotate phosphoribosyltransferase [Dehalococcoidia bacterium]MDP7485659.1 orotate phosphoribosyltransferase [Dehalococcoidia bacterium]HJP27609.1 orotate phosphoribosyltransferase [Dehalococcoidia bacterium]|tara:strand:- start:15145 stop:15729 length:585 start_codon:yes stop_codon:yes gene_type:complete